MMDHLQWKKIGISEVLALVIVFSGLTFSPSAMAMELDFNISAPTSGTVSYSGSGGVLTGSNIEVDNVVGLSMPANSNVTSVCVTCVLNFTTGTLSAAGGPPLSGSNNWWSFGSGGTITITGGIQLQGGIDIAPGSPLLTGTFNSAFVQDLGLQGFKVTFGTFFDTKHPDLLTYYGLPPSTQFQGAFTLLFASPDAGIASAFTSSSIFSGNVVNTAVAVVPLPVAAVLFASGLSGISWFALRKGGPHVHPLV